MARDRRAALRDGDRRRLHRRRDHGHAPGRRDAVRRLRLLRAGTTSSPSPPSSATAPARRCRSSSGSRRAAASPAGRSTRRTRRARSRTSPGLKCVCPATPEDAKGLLVSRDRGPEPGPLLRAQAPLPPHQGRGARGALHDPDRQGAHPPRGRRHLRDHLGRDGLHRRGGREAARGGRRLGRDRRPAHGDAVGQGGGARERRARPRRCSCCTRTRAPAASAPRSRRRSPRRRSRTSTRR